VYAGEVEGDAQRKWNATRVGRQVSSVWHTTRPADARIRTENWTRNGLRIRNRIRIPKRHWEASGAGTKNRKRTKDEATRCREQGQRRALWL